MSSEEGILDNPDKKPVEIVKSDNRIYKDLTIVIGVIYILLSLFLLYTVYTVISWKMEAIGIMGYGIADINWFKLIGQSSPGLIYASFFFVGSIGLFLRATWGWIVSLSIAVFALIFPLVSLLRDLVYSGASADTPFWLLILLILVFGAKVVYFLVKPTRKIFRPSRKSFIIAAVLILGLIVHQQVMPLIQ